MISLKELQEASGGSLDAAFQRETARVNAQSTKGVAGGKRRRRRKRKRLGELLVEAGVITEEDLEGCLNRQSTGGGRLGELLIEMGVADEDRILPILAAHLGVASVRLRDGMVDPQVVHAIPRSLADRLCALALFRVRSTLFVAMADPDNLLHLDELESATNCRVEPILSFRSTITKLLPRCYEEDFAVDEVTAGLDDDAVEIRPDVVRVDLSAIAADSNGSPVINLVNYMLVHAVREGASDIHVEPGRRHSSIRFRVDGQLREVLRPRRDLHAALISRIKVMARLDIAEHRMPQDGRVHVVVEGNEIDLRASTLPTVLGEKIVLRVLDRKNVTFDLGRLGVPDHQLNVIRQMLRRPHGLVLATGPTGSGKTTTLYSALELIKTVHRNVVTVEDPVEYQLELVNQVHANMGGSVTFAGALRSILRQDPDVIMIGEIRDEETAEIAIQAALTGHLVLSTLHTNDCVGALTRLRDMGVASYKISAALAGVIAQRLVRNICPECKTLHFPKKDVLDDLGYEGDRRHQFSRGEGCSSCFDTGFLGRTGIYEVLAVNRDVRDMITPEMNSADLREVFHREGNVSLLSQGIRLAEQGVTSPEEVLRVAGTHI